MILLAGALLIGDVETGGGIVRGWVMVAEMNWEGLYSKGDGWGVEGGGGGAGEGARCTGSWR